MSLQVDLLEQSFEGIKPHADSFVNSFYDNLFTANPEAKPLFANTNMAEQKKKLLGSLVLVVENLRKPDVLENSLRGLGARHLKYGALPEHYPLVGNALLTTFGQYLGDKWTLEVKQAWVDAYGAITEIMLDGADYSQAEVALDAPVTTEEDTETAKKKSDSDEGSLNVELLERSFCQIRPRLSEFAASFYNNLFITYPETKPLFAKTDMKAQEQKLVDSLLLVVLNLRKPGFLTQALKDLGARHTNYGTVSEHYPLVGDVLLTTFEQYLGSDWNPQVKQAWTDAYNLISKIMLEGANSSRANFVAENSPTPPESSEQSVLGQANNDAIRGVNSNPNLSAPTTENKSSFGLLAGLVAGSGLLIVLLLILL